MDVSGLSNYTNYYSGLASNNKSEALSGKLNNTGANATDDQLMEVCKEFESYLMEQVFKNMEKTIMYADEDSTNTNQLVDFFKDRTLQELTSQATNQNSVGLAQMLYDQLKRNLGVSADQT